MTQEIINKLHKLERNRQYWIDFKDALCKYQNVSVHGECKTKAIINTNIEFGSAFLSDVIQLVGKNIHFYDDEIAKL